MEEEAMEEEVDGKEALLGHLMLNQKEEVEGKEEREGRRWESIELIGLPRLRSRFDAHVGVVKTFTEGRENLLEGKRRFYRADFHSSRRKKAASGLGSILI